MYAIIRSSISIDLDKNFIYDSGEHYEIMEVFKHLIRFDIESLIIDISDLDEDLLISELKRYRIKKDNKIIIIGKNLLKSKKIVTKLIALGIYNIVDVNEDDTRESINEMLENELKRTGSYRDVVKYIVDDATSEPKQVIRRVFSQKIVGTVVIGVSAAQEKIGCTHVSISLARAIKQKLNKKVAIIQYNSGSFKYIANSYGLDESESFELEGITYFRSMKDFLLIMKDYDYIVLDVGKKYDDNEFLRADIKFMICGTKEWELHNLDKYISGDDKYKYENTYLFNFTESKVYLDLKKEMTDFKTGLLPYNPNPYSNEGLLNYLKFINSVLPSERKSIIKKFFRKQG